MYFQTHLANKTKLCVKLFNGFSQETESHLHYNAQGKNILSLDVAESLQLPVM